MVRLGVVVGVELESESSLDVVCCGADSGLLDGVSVTVLVREGDEGAGVSVGALPPPPPIRPSVVPGLPDSVWPETVSNPVSTSRPTMNADALRAATSAQRLFHQGPFGFGAADSQRSTTTVGSAEGGRTGGWSRPGSGRRTVGASPEGSRGSLGRSKGFTRGFAGGWGSRFTDGFTGRPGGGSIRLVS